MPAVPRSLGTAEATAQSPLRYSHAGMPHDPHDLLTAIPISIIAAAILALVARTVRQPLILGYIAAGIVLGAHLGLGVITDEASVEVISEIGLIFLLFIIGLEINVRALAQAGPTILVTGLLQFPISAALAWFILGRGWGGQGNLDGLYLAVALSLSSTLIVVKLLTDKYEISTFGGQVTLGVLVFQDLWAIVFMALQPNLNDLQPGPLIRSLLAGVALVAFAALMFLIPAVALQCRSTYIDGTVATLLAIAAACSSAERRRELPREQSRKATQPVPWTDAFDEPAVLIAADVRIEGPRGLLDHVATVSDSPRVRLWLLAFTAIAAGLGLLSGSLSVALMPLLVLALLD